MSLSDSEIRILSMAGSNPDAVQRQQAVGILLSKRGPDAQKARELLAASYVEQTQPSFHLIPGGDAMADEVGFARSCDLLARDTDRFTLVSQATLSTALSSEPAALAPLRMILGLTHNELAVATRLVDPQSTISGNALKNFERRPPPAETSQTRLAMIALVARTAMAVMDREVLQVPETATPHFHSKLDKRDTTDGWDSVAGDAGGVPYSALLYQRYVGGVWRQVQDAYSEVKGDALLEVPLQELLTRNGIPHHHTKRGAAGARETAEKYGLSPGADFVIPDKSPTLVIESKVGEDGGTVRDKAARVKSMSESATRLGLKPCAIVDGKGWSERANALVDVVIATQGRTYTLATLEQVLELPEVRSLRRTAE